MFRYKTDNIPIRHLCGAFAYDLHLLSYTDSLIQCHSKRAVLWRFTVAGNNVTYMRIYVSRPTFLSNFNQNCCFRIIFFKVLRLKFHGNSSSGTNGRACSEQALFETMRTRLKISEEFGRNRKNGTGE